MYTLSPSLNDSAFTPSSHLMVNITSVIVPNISSMRPILVLFCRYTNALKYGIFVPSREQTMSPSHGRMKLPISTTVSGGPWSKPRPPRPRPRPRPRPPPRPRPRPPNPPRPLPRPLIFNKLAQCTRENVLWKMATVEKQTHKSTNKKTQESTGEFRLGLSLMPLTSSPSR